MDDETKATIDSLLSGKSKKGRYAPETHGGAGYARPFGCRVETEKPFAEPWTTREEAGKAPPEPDTDKASKIYERYKPKTSTSRAGGPDFCYTEAEGGVNLKNETATLSVDTSCASIVFKGPLTDDLICRITNAVPVTQREWLADKRVWRFSPACINIIKPILKDTYKDVQMLGVPKALPATKFDQLISKLSKDDKAAIYRLLASKYHPDKGGSHEVMTLINIVFRG